VLSIFIGILIKTTLIHTRACARANTHTHTHTYTQRDRDNCCRNYYIKYNTVFLFRYYIYFYFKYIFSLYFFDIFFLESFLEFSVVPSSSMKVVVKLEQEMHIAFKGPRLAIIDRSFSCSSLIGSSGITQRIRMYCSYYFKSYRFVLLAI